MKTRLACMCLVSLVAATSPCPGQENKERTYAGQPLAYWIKALRSKEVLPRVRALNVLIEEGGPQVRAAIPALMDVFKDDKHEFLHPLAAVALSKTGRYAVSTLMRGLQDKKKQVRIGSALALGMIGPEARRAMTDLRDALSDREPAVRSTAAVALGQIGPAARRVAPALRTALKDKDISVRVEAAAALWAVSGESKDAVPVLIDVLKQKDKDLKLKAAQILAKIGSAGKGATPFLKPLLEAKELRTRVLGASALWKVSGESEQALKVLFQALNTGDPVIRFLTVGVLDSMVTQERAVTMLLWAALADRDVKVRREATRALAQLGPGQDKHRKALRVRAQEGDATVRWWASVALLSVRGENPGTDIEDEVILRALRDGLREVRKPGSLVQLPGDKASRAMAPLILAVKSKKLRLRKQAVEALGLLGPTTKPAIPVLLEVLKDAGPELFLSIGNTLGAVGPTAIPDLIKVAESPIAKVRAGAVRGLGGMGRPTPQMGKVLRQGLRDRDPLVRVETALALWRLDLGAATAISFLFDRLQDDDGKGRWQAARALGTIHFTAGGSIEKVTEGLVKALKGKDQLVRLYALWSLWKVDREERVVIPLVRDCLTARDEEVRRVAMKLVGAMGRDVKTGPFLLAGLQDRSPTVREEAMQALTSKEEDAIPLLTEALSHKNPGVRARAAEVLGRIGPPVSKVPPTMKALTMLQKDKDANVRKQAMQTMKLISECDVERLTIALELVTQLEK